MRTGPNLWLLLSTGTSVALVDEYQRLKAVGVGVALKAPVALRVKNEWVIE
jgi:hypothetical protein